MTMSAAAIEHKAETFHGVGRNVSGQHPILFSHKAESD
jgi:hypothetical protein